MISTGGCCYWKKMVFKLSPGLLWQWWKTQFPEWNTALVPLAGAWSVPKVFNVDIRTMGFKQGGGKQKDDSRKSYCRNGAEAIRAEWKRCRILKQMLCACGLLWQIKCGWFYEVWEDYFVARLPLPVFLFINCTVCERWERDREEGKAIQQLMSFLFQPEKSV